MVFCHQPWYFCWFTITRKNNNWDIFAINHVGSCETEDQNFKLELLPKTWIHIDQRPLKMTSKTPSKPKAVVVSTLYPANLSFIFSWYPILSIGLYLMCISLIFHSPTLTRIHSDIDRPKCNTRPSQRNRRQRPHRPMQEPHVSGSRWQCHLVSHVLESNYMGFMVYKWNYTKKTQDLIGSNKQRMCHGHVAWDSYGLWSSHAMNILTYWV